MENDCILIKRKDYEDLVIKSIKDERFILRIDVSHGLTNNRYDRDGFVPYITRSKQLDISLGIIENNHIKFGYPLSKQILRIRDILQKTLNAEIKRHVEELENDLENSISNEKIKNMGIIELIKYRNSLKAK